MSRSRFFVVEHPCHQAHDVRRRRSVQARQVGLAFKNRGDRVGRGLAFERTPAGEHFVQDAAECPDVGAFVYRLAARLLGRHVRDRPEQLALNGRRHHRQRVGQRVALVWCR
jgi:hypothetical protein